MGEEVSSRLKIEENYKPKSTRGEGGRVWLDQSRVKNERQRSKSIG